MACRIPVLNSFSFLRTSLLLSTKKFVKFYTTSVYCRYLSSTNNFKMNTETKWIAAIQMTSGNDKIKNIEVCNSLIEYAVSHKQAKMVFLPEGFDFIASGRDETVQLAESMNGPVVENYKNVAKKHGVWLSLGGFHHKYNDEPVGSAKITNAHIIIDANGEVVAVYNKAHLFDVSIPEQNLELRESNTVKSGEELLVPVDTPVGKVGLAICYDLRFPEFSERLRRFGAELLTYPSAFTKHTGAAHWEILQHDCSLIVNPWGVIVAQACSSEQVIFAEIDPEELGKIRKEMPNMNHKRYELYDGITQRGTYSLPESTDDVFDFGQVKVKTKFSFLESKLSRAFVNRKCILPGHVLVISKRKVPRLNILTDEEICDLHVLAKNVVKIMEYIHGSTAANVACQDGLHAGQSISHVHIHILPRKEGDLARPDEVHERLENFGKDNEEPKWRNEEEMLEECNDIRT